MSTKEPPLAGEARVRKQSKSPRRPAHTTAPSSFKEARAPRMPSPPAQQASENKTDKGDSGQSSGLLLLTEEDSEKQPLLEDAGDDDLEEPSSDSQQARLLASVPQQVVARYTTSELLALRDSRLVRAPEHFSAPGSQVKLPEMAPGGGRNTRHSSALAYIGLENIGRAQKDIVLAPQREAGASARAAGASQRVFGVARGSVSSPGAAAAAAAADGSRSNSVSMGSEGVRANYGRAGSSTNANPAAAGAQAGVRHSISHDGGGRLGATSWRSSGPARATAAANGGGGGCYGGEDAAQPEWMADELTYDEGQSARQMQDIEEWKRRMKEGASQQQAVAADEGAARGSRFLRMFSNGFEQQQQQQQQQGGGGDPMAKLLKVFGDKVSVGAPSLEPPPGLLAQQPPTLLPPPPPPAEAVLQQMAQASFEASLSPASASASASVGSGQHRLKAASPAPINEALRGIVPTSVFRKSVQSSNSSSSAGAPAASRAATPARSLPSWLVELSRGRSSSPLAEDQALLTNASLITNASLGAHDLVDALERGFPALHARPRPLDSQSISSLSVQASAGGPPSEACGGDRQAPVTSAAEAPPPPPPEALAMAPPGMLGQQHVMLADGTLLPGGMGPPMGMMPPHPPHPLALGFHPGMMYGMLPGAPPGMLFGPPGMMYGMPPPPHMYSVGMAYPGMPIAVPSSAPEPGLLPPPGQPPNQAFQHHQHQ